MRPTDNARAMDLKRQKVLKRMVRDQKELESLNKELEDCLEKKAILTKESEAALSEISAAATAAASSVLHKSFPVDQNAASQNVGNATTESPTVPAVEAAGSTPVVVTQTPAPLGIDDSAMEVVEQQPSSNAPTTDGATTASGSNADPLSAVGIPDVTSILSSASALETRIREIRSHISTVTIRFNRAIKEEDELSTFFCLTVEGRFHVVNWMLAMQKILWPSNEEEAEAGRPVDAGLPIGVQSHMDAAKTLGISEFTDVLQLEEYFKWMAWCHQCLMTLRLPPKSSEYRMLIAKAKECKMAEEKLVKNIAGLLSRAT